MRADLLLVDRGLAATRSQAQRLIASGVLWREGDSIWKKIAKNGDELPVGSDLQLTGTAEAKYISRGGLKLEGALSVTGLKVTGLFCLDLGQSTGGFTDCLLQRGARAVASVDVGYGELAFVFVDNAPFDVPDFTDRLKAIPHVLECHAVAGEWGYLLKVRAESTPHLEQVLHQIRMVDDVNRTHSVIGLSTAFETTSLPVPEPAADDDEEPAQLSTRRKSA